LGWQREGELPIHVSVNLSARQFVQEDLLADIELMIEELQINPRCLELELTESSIMPNAEDTIETLQALKKQGIGISVDDFGTGYSSLSYLKRFPIDILKIDQSFIRDISVDSDGNALVTAIIAMAHNLKLQVVAEGVETYQQLNFLRQHHCDYAQGFLFGKAVPAQEFRAMLKNPPFLQENNEFANLSLSLFEDFRNPSF
jgi:EAL domain-containing protein (putative c-di-GMP-specific phosphodiesterase class I)